MTEWFGENCFWIFHRFPPQYIKDSFNICMEKDIHEIKYFWGCMRHRKKMEQVYKEFKEKTHG